MHYYFYLGTCVMGACVRVSVGERGRYLHVSSTCANGHSFVHREAQTLNTQRIRRRCRRIGHWPCADSDDMVPTKIMLPGVRLPRSHF